MRQVSSTLSSRAKYWWSPTIAACSSTSYGSGGSPSSRAKEVSKWTVRQDCPARADSCSRRPGSGSIRRTIWLGSALVGSGRKASRGVRRRSSRTSVTMCGSALPARRKMGTSAQRQLSISSRSAGKVSVAEPLATPGTSAYPWYWPRTQC